MSDRNTREEQALLKYLADRKVLIVDASAASRSGLFKVLHDLGAQTSNLMLTNTFEDAQTAIQSAKPHMVIAEYDLGRRCGLELLQTQREQRPEESRECLFVVVTGNTSQTAVARAAEEDIDAYVFKPYTIESVRKTILQAVIRKLRPPEYYVAIEAAKKFIAENNLDEADKELERAIGLDPAPSLALYYQGRIKQLRANIDGSRGKYQKGLEFNRIHYKCMIGLYDLFMQQKSYNDAYQVVKKVSQYFPANPKRLTEVLHLAVLTGQYEDIEKYYATFVNIDVRDEKLVRYVCAALVVCGKHYLKASLSSRALELFRKASATGQGRVNILREIVLALIEHGMTKDVPYYLERFPAETWSTNEFLLLKVLLADAENQVPLVINQGRALVAKGMADARLFEVMLRRGIEAKLTAMALEDIMGRAATAFPDKKAHFEQILAKAKSKTAA